MSSLAEERARKARDVTAALFEPGFTERPMGLFHYRRERFIEGGKRGVIVKLRTSRPPDWLAMYSGSGSEHVIFAAYPHPSHAVEISKGVSGLSINEFVASPGYDLPGSLGLLAGRVERFKTRPPKVYIDFLQGGYVQSQVVNKTDYRWDGVKFIPVPEQRTITYVDKSVARHYFGWNRRLIDQLFRHAGADGDYADVREISLARRFEKEGRRRVERGVDNVESFQRIARAHGFSVRTTRNNVYATRR